MFLKPGKADVQKMYLQVITSAFGHNNIFAFISWKGWKEELIMYSSEVIEEVISRNDIVDVISGYIKLKKNGSSYVRKIFHRLNHARESIALVVKNNDKVYNTLLDLL